MGIPTLTDHLPAFAEDPGRTSGELPVSYAQFIINQTNFKNKMKKIKVQG